MYVEELSVDFFFGAKGLIEFNASHNLLKTVRKHQFAFAHNLRSVDLSFNQISNIDKEAFDDRSKLLERLDLSQNRIRNIRFVTFVHLERLEYLNLAHNDLHVIKPGLFSHQSALILLDLSYNSIKMVDLGVILPSSTKMRIFNVIGNEEIEVLGYNQTIYPRLSVVRNTPVSEFMNIREKYDSVLKNSSFIIIFVFLTPVLVIIISAIASIVSYVRVRNLRHQLNSIITSLQNNQNVDNDGDAKTDDHIYDVIRFTP